MIGHIILFLIVLTLAVIVHEFGHWWFFKHYFNRDVSFYVNWLPTKIPGVKIPEIIVGNDKDYKILSDKDKMSLYVTGIMFGFLPILMASAFVSVWYTFLIVLYVHGCSSDMNELFRLVKNRQKELAKVLKR